MPKAVDTPFLTTEEAASYVRYSVSQFKRHVAASRIPAYGPHENRFRRDELDEWMMNPDTFRHKLVAPKRRAGGFTPVTA